MIDFSEVSTALKLTPIAVGAELIETCSARDIWKFVESKQDFSTWVKSRIDKYGFIESKDFIRLHKKMEANNATTIDYHCTVSMAKELGMVEANAKGKIVRQYFLECEKLAKSTAITQTLKTTEAKQALKDWMDVADLFSVPTHYAQAEGVKMVHLTYDVDYSPLLLKSPAQDNITEDVEMLEVTELSEQFNIPSAHKVNLIFEACGLQNLKGKQWIPTEKGKSLCAKHSWVVGKKSGYNLKWNVAGVATYLSNV